MNHKDDAKKADVINPHVLQTFCVYIYILLVSTNISKIHIATKVKFHSI